MRRCPPRVDHALGGDQPYSGQLDDLIAPGRDRGRLRGGPWASPAPRRAVPSRACAVAGGAGKQPPGPPGQPVDRHSLIQPRGAGDRLPAGPRRHRACDRHQRAGRHQRPSSPRWISSIPGTATTVHLAGCHRRQRQRGTGRARPPARLADLVDLRLVGCALRAGDRGGHGGGGGHGGTRQPRWPGWPTASAHAVSACARDGWCCPVASPRRCRSNRARPSRQNWTGWVRWRLQP